MAERTGWSVEEQIDVSPEAVAHRARTGTYSATCSVLASSSAKASWYRVCDNRSALTGGAMYNSGSALP